MQQLEFLTDPHENLLPQDGTVNYFGKIMDEAIANDYFEQLLTHIEWQKDYH